MKSHDCLKDRRVRRRERARLELFAESTSDNDYLEFEKEKRYSETTEHSSWKTDAKARITKDSSRKLKDLLLGKKREGEGRSGRFFMFRKAVEEREAEKGACSMVEDDLHACFCIGVQNMAARVQNGGARSNPIDGRALRGEGEEKRLDGRNRNEASIALVS